MAKMSHENFGNLTCMDLKRNTLKIKTRDVEKAADFLLNLPYNC